MRKIMALLFLSPLLCLSQDCSEEFTKKSDKFTESITIQTDVMKIENLKEKIAWHIGIHDPDKKSTKIFFTFAVNQGEGLDCIDEGAKVMLLLDNGDKIIRPTAYKYNCSGIAVLAFTMKGLASKGYIKMIEQLCQHKINAIRIDGRSENYDYDFSEDQGDAIMQAIRCANTLVNDYKK